MHGCKGCGREFDCPNGRAGYSLGDCADSLGRSVEIERKATVCSRCLGQDRAERKARRRAELDRSTPAA
jgi:hypothetical protein